MPVAGIMPFPGVTPFSQGGFRYTAAMAGAKTKTWKPFYQHYRTRGWSFTAALVILARKIARVAFALHRNGSTFNPQLAAMALT